MPPGAPAKSAPAKSKRGRAKSQPVLPKEVSDAFANAARDKRRARRHARDEPSSSSEEEGSSYATGPEPEAEDAATPLQKFSRDLDAHARTGSKGKGKGAARDDNAGGSLVKAKGPRRKQQAQPDGTVPHRVETSSADSSGAAAHGSNPQQAADQSADLQEAAVTGADLSQAAAEVAGHELHKPVAQRHPPPGCQCARRQCTRYHSGVHALAEAFARHSDLAGRCRPHTWQQ